MGRTHDGDGDVAVEGLNSGGERGLTIGVVEVLAGSHVELKHLNQITVLRKTRGQPDVSHNWRRMTLNVRVGLGGVEEQVVGDGSGEGGVDGGEDGGVLEHISDTWTKKSHGRADEV